MRMKKRSIALLIVAIVLVSIYWNFNPTYSKTHPRTNASNVEETSLKADEQQLSHNKKHVAFRYTTTTIITNATPKAQTFARTSNPRTQDSNFKLQQRILQLEKMLNQSQLRRKVIFIGPSSTLKKEMPLYKPSLLKHGYVVETILERKKIDDELIEWSGLMCYGDPWKKSCLNKGELAKVEVHQKISYIPGLVQVFSPPHSFCYTMSQTLHISVLSQFPMSVPCHVVPPKSNLNLLKKLLESTDDRSLFLIKSSHELSMFSKKKTFKESLLRSKGVLQVISHPFLVSGLPVLVKFYVIITSMSPLRIYRHLDGQASVMTLDKGQIKVTWTLENFKDHLNKHYTKHDVDKVWSNVDRTIVNTLMVSESLLGSNDLDSSKNNFQLLEFHFTLNSSVHPLLLEVKVPDAGTTLQGVANDTMDLLFTMTSSYSHVTDALEKLKDIIGVKGVNCHDKHSVCLSDQELIYLLESHRENTALGRFKKLYPMHDSRKYQPLLTELKSSSVGMVTSQQRGTPQLHGTLVLMENYGNYGNQRTETMTAVQHVDKRKGYWETDDDDDSADKGIEDNQEFPNHLDDCDDDPSIVPVLTDILIEPEAKLKPSFTSEILEYELVFPFDVMTVNVWGKTSTCRSQARVNSKAKTTKEPLNYSLGVGWNKFVIHLINLFPRSYAVIASYNIHIYRRTRSEKAFDPRSPHEMCAFKQDCDLKTFPEMPCGPQSLPQKSFQEFKLSRKGLPFCDNGHAQGSWVLPCANCNQPRSCYWNEAMWTPQSCQHKLLTTKQAKTCLAKKKILFVGDSTNRGMMYYLMEKINGSLHQWEKTHSMKVYSSALNDDQTSVSFAYYPQFWLPSDRKPVFLKALHHLMAKFMPLHNSTDTILVVGGVQWLLPSHVTAVKSTIESLGLGGIKVLVKSLGSGFHLPVPGFVQLDLEGQKKVSRRNQLLIKKAKNVGFEVIDTHTMTVSRYKEFVMGKCGCHFHKVVDMRSHKKELNDDNTVIDDVNNGLPRYHVIGSINKAYADIMISRMCS